MNDKISNEQFYAIAIGLMVLVAGIEKHHPGFLYRISEMVAHFYIAIAVLFIAAIPISIIQGVWKNRKEDKNPN